MFLKSNVMVYELITWFLANSLEFLVRLHGEYNILVKLCGNTT